MSATKAAPDSGEERPKKRRWFFAFSGNALLIAILLHVLFAVGATYLIVEHFQKKHVNFQATAPPNPHTEVEHKIEMAKRNNVESAPPDLKRIVTTAVSSITLPDVPEVPQEDEVMPTTMSGVSGGMGSGSGSGNATGTGPGESDVVMALKKQLGQLLFRLPSAGRWDGHCPLTDDNHVDMHIDDGQVHTCNLLVRGIVERNIYDGGKTIKDYLNIEGTPEKGILNIYELKVDDPPQLYYLNAGEAGVPGVCVLNYTMDIKVKDGSHVTLHADSVDSQEKPNGHHLLAPDDVPDHPIAVKQPYEGQFIQVDAISIDP